MNAVRSIRNQEIFNFLGDLVRANKSCKDLSQSVDSTAVEAFTAWASTHEYLVGSCYQLRELKRKIEHLKFSPCADDDSSSSALGLFGVVCKTNELFPATEAPAKRRRLDPVESAEPSELEKVILNAPSELSDYIQQRDRLTVNDSSLIAFYHKIGQIDLKRLLPNIGDPTDLFSLIFAEDRDEDYALRALRCQRLNSAFTQQHQIDAIESLQNLLHNKFLEIPITHNEFDEWSKKFGSLFTADSLQRIPVNRLMELTALFHALKENIPGDLYRQYVQNLPLDAKNYLGIIGANNSARDKLLRIKALFSWNEQHCFGGIAHLVNTQKIPLKELLTKRLFNKDQLLKMAPWLRYVDTRKIYTTKDPEFEIRLIGRCHTVNFLIIQNCRVEALPELPFCKKLDCSYCSKLQCLPHLPLCIKLECNQCIRLQKFSGDLPLCEIFICHHCRGLEQLPQLPNCRHLDCSYCIRLRELPELPLCVILTCYKCNKLSWLPNLPVCEELYCFECFMLYKLSELPLCKQINCSDCHRLKLFPEELPLCTFIDCSKCFQLQVLPKLPLCIKLDCNRCSALIQIPELPLCENICCDWCGQLRFLPAVLPQCRVLSCLNCLQLPSLPEVPGSAEVYAGNGYDFSYLSVDIEVLKEKPKNFLLNLGKKYLLQNHPFPRINYPSSPAVDLGGVGRDFLIRLFDSLFLNRRDESETVPISSERDRGIFPVAVAGDEQLRTCYRTIGKIFALCCTTGSNFKIGSIFDPRLFQLLKIYDIDDYPLRSEETLMQALLMLKGLSTTILQLTTNGPVPLLDDATLMNATYVLHPDEIPETAANFSDPANRAELRRVLLKEAKADGRILAASYIAFAMNMALTEEDKERIDGSDAEALQNMIQGKLTAELLKEKIRWKRSNTVLDTNAVRTKEYLNTWITEATQEQLHLFVRAITSNNTLCPRNIIIEVHNRDLSPPIAHTCSFTMELSAEYPDQEVFNEKLEFLLAEATEDFGFM